MNEGSLARSSPEAREDDTKARIRELFAHVKPEHREQVLGRLKDMTNDQRVGYLRGWTKAKL